MAKNKLIKLPPDFLSFGKIGVIGSDGLIRPIVEMEKSVLNVFFTPISSQAFDGADLQKFHIDEFGVWK
jgi:hypothetical protein